MDFSLHIEATGSHVPHKGLVQGHATFMPGAAQPSCRLPLDLSRVNDSPRFRHRPYAFDTLPVVHTLRLPAPYLTRSSRAVSVTLTTSALDRGSARRFEASPMPGGSEGPALIPRAAWLQLGGHLGLLSAPSWRTVSRPGESHPRALAELYVNVSAHTAPIIQPPVLRLRVARRLLPRARLTVWTRWMTRPLCSIEFPRLHRSYGSLRPCASHRASHPWGSAPWISPFTSRRQVPTFHTRAWYRVTPPLCRVPPSQAAGSRWTCPGLTTRPGFDTVLTLSTRCRWFIHFVSLHPT